MTLQTLQNAFLEALFLSPSALSLSSLATTMTSAIENSIHESVDKILVYRNNSTMGRLKALSHTFPVTLQLLGEECFQGLANYYIAHNPSVVTSLNDEGKFFVEYVVSHFNDLTSLHALPYLKDMLRFEWCLHCVSIGPENARFDFQQFSEFLTDNPHFQNIIFRLADNSCLFSSVFPVDKIWENNQAAKDNLESMPIIDLDNNAGIINLFIWRPHVEVYVKRLTMAEMAVIRCVQKKMSFFEIEKQLINYSLTEPIEKLIPGLIQIECITGFNAGIFVGSFVGSDLKL